MAETIAPSPRRFDRHFQWRGTSVSRLEGFADAVFAIVLALLFLRAAPPETFHDLKAAMKALLPFALTFAIIAYVWVEHWLFTRRYDLTDAWTVFLNLLLLFRKRGAVVGAGRVLRSGDSWRPEGKTLRYIP